MSKRMVESLVALHEMVSSEEQEDEVLYGWAGYLYCLLSLIHKKVEHPKLSELVLKTVQVIVKDGTSWIENKNRLMIKWPRDRKDGKYYLGGAHGLIGVLFMLL